MVNPPNERNEGRSPNGPRPPADETIRTANQTLPPSLRECEQQQEELCDGRHGSAIVTESAGNCKSSFLFLATTLWAAMAHWTLTLAEVERSIGDCLESLERYETAFGRVLATHGTPLATPDDGWDDRLARANEAAGDAERLLDEQDGVWQRWRETLAEWKSLTAEQR
jgi:hypothetical protein